MRRRPRQVQCGPRSELHHDDLRTGFMSRERGIEPPHSRTNSTTLMGSTCRSNLWPSSCLRPSRARSHRTTPSTLHPEPHDGWPPQPRLIFHHLDERNPATPRASVGEAGLVCRTRGVRRHCSGSTSRTLRGDRSREAGWPVARAPLGVQAHGAVDRPAGLVEGKSPVGGAKQSGSAR